MNCKPFYAVILAFALGAASRCPAQDWRPLFPTDDLTGWETEGGEWTLKEGLLSGKSTTVDDALLISSDGYADFELQFQYRLKGWAIGGAFFRLNVQETGLYGLQAEISPMLAARESPMRTSVPGVAAIHRIGGPKMGPEDRETRIFNDEADPGPPPPMNEWNAVNIRAVSGNLEVSVNGETFTKGIDDEFLTGRLAFGVQRALPGDLEIKEVRIRELENEEGYESIFNGKDLSGWKVHGQDDQWKVEEGIILSESIDGAYSYLATAKEYKNFSILAEFQGLANGNSGLFFHSHLDGTAISGIQAEVQPPTKDRLGHSGCLYDAAGRGWIVDPETLTKEQEGAFLMNEWNTIRVDVQDHHIKTWLNGLRVVDFQDDAPAHPSGVIALQIHSGGGVKVNWRNIRIKGL